MATSASASRRRERLQKNKFAVDPNDDRWAGSDNFDVNHEPYAQDEEGVDASRLNWVTHPVVDLQSLDALQTGSKKDSDSDSEPITR